MKDEGIRSMVRRYLRTTVMALLLWSVRTNIASKRRIDTNPCGLNEVFEEL